MRGHKLKKITIDARLLKLIDESRGLIKRPTFIEKIIWEWARKRWARARVA